jgi:transcriptional regulator with XRE-family HTH domain
MLQKTHASLGQITPESNRTSSVKAQLLHNLKNSKEYRRAFVEEKVRAQLAIQIKTIREQRRMERTTFADLLRKAYSWVFRLEDPNQAPPTIPSLLNVADVFDVDLDIRFRRFSDLLNQIEHMGPESFKVPSFEAELESGGFDVIDMRAAQNRATGEVDPDKAQKQDTKSKPALMRAESDQYAPEPAMGGHL